MPCGRRCRKFKIHIGQISRHRGSRSGVRSDSGIGRPDAVRSVVRARNVCFVILYLSRQHCLTGHAPNPGVRHTTEHTQHRRHDPTGKTNGNEQACKSATHLPMSDAMCTAKTTSIQELTRWRAEGTHTPHAHDELAACACTRPFRTQPAAPPSPTRPGQIWRDQRSRCSSQATALATLIFTIFT